MKKAAMALGLAMLLTAAGCVSVPLTGKSQQARTTADEFLTALKQGRYQDAYGFFAGRLQKERPLARHIEVMKALTHDLGPLEDYQPVVMPFLAQTPMEKKLIAGDRADVSRSTYELDFRNGSIVTRLDMVMEDGREKVLVFDFIWSTLQDDKGMAKRLHELGYL